jgi:beta-propeller repeat-containing protein
LAICLDFFDAVFRENKAICQFALPFLGENFMKYSTNAIRRWSLLALALIGLLQVPAGPTSVRPDRVLAAQDPPPTRLNHERSISRSPRPGADQKTKARVSEAYGSLPIRFESNAGQTDAKVKFLSRGGGYNLFLTQSEAVLTLRRGNSQNGGDAQSVVGMKLIGADPASQMEGLDELPGKSNYIIGKDVSRWRRNVASFAKVRYRSVYPGIDLIYYGNQRQIEYDFVVAPGADPNAIRLGFDGVSQIEIDAQGDLVLRTTGGEVRQRKPVAYQEVDGSRREVASRYALRGKQEVVFELGEYDHARPLVIDPVVAYSTYLGGSSGELANAIAVDSAGNAYVTGLTFSADFPTSNPLQPNPGGANDQGDVFVAKLNPEGSALVYSTYLGGSNLDEGLGIAVDEYGSSYLTGNTFSLDFPTMNPLQQGLGGFVDLFVTKLSPDGSALVYSTFLGGNGTETGFDLAIDNKRNVYVAGATDSGDFPTMNPLQPAMAGSQDVFAAKLKADGSALVYSTYLGGADFEALFGVAIAVDRFGCLYLTGDTLSTDFPTANPLKGSHPVGDLDAFVTKISANGATLVYSTYLGGDNGEVGSGIAVDRFGNAYVTGSTNSTNFPTVNPLQPVLSGDVDAFVTKFNRNGSALIYSTYLGGAGNERSTGVAVDSRNSVYIIGLTNSTDFPTVDATQPMPDSADLEPIDAFSAKLEADGSGLIYSTYLGGKGFDWASRIAVDERGNAYVCGFTDSDDLPATPGAFQREYRDPNGDRPLDAFITKIFAPRRHHHDHDED